MHTKTHEFLYVYPDGSRRVLILSPRGDDDFYELRVVGGGSALFDSPEIMVEVGSALLEEAADWRLRRREAEEAADD